jgi:hypothetical protein
MRAGVVREESATRREDTKPLFQNPSTVGAGGKVMQNTRIHDDVVAGIGESCRSDVADHIPLPLGALVGVSHAHGRDIHSCQSQVESSEPGRECTGPTAEIDASLTCARLNPSIEEPDEPSICALTEDIVFTMHLSEAIEELNFPTRVHS